jgi:hypothetical protein
MACFHPWQSKTLLGKSGSDQDSCLNRPDRPSEPRKEPLFQSLIFLTGWAVALRSPGKLHIRGNQCGLRPIFDLQLFHDASDVNFNRAFADR